LPRCVTALRDELRTAHATVDAPSVGPEHLTKLDRDKANVNGGSIALGNPIGATGSIPIGTLLDALKRRDLKRGLVTMCAAGGMAARHHHRAGLRSVPVSHFSSRPPA